MIIPGFIVAFFTFPGVIVHELAHQFFCRLFQVPVFKVCYFRLGTPSGYVVHEPPASPWVSILIGVGPLFVNTVIGLVVALPATLSMRFNALHAEGTEVYMVLLNGFLMWLGFSIAMHSFPSRGDAGTIWEKVTDSSSLWVKVVGMPLVAAIWVGALGSIFWLDAIYGVVIVYLIPNLCLHSLAASLE